MQSTPNNKCPVSAMPQSTQEHCEHEINVSADFTFSIATERDVEIIPQPCRERYMPSSPKIRKTDCTIWIPEIFRQHKSKTKGSTNSTSGISRKVEKDLT